MIYINAIPVYKNKILTVQDGQLCCYECGLYSECSREDTKIPVKVACSNFDSIMED